MLHIIITPCLLGFNVDTYRGNGFKRYQGIYTMHELFLMLVFTEDDYVIELR